jgi:hypothetical protein
MNGFDATLGHPTSVTIDVDFTVFGDCIALKGCQKGHHRAIGFE